MYALSLFLIILYSTHNSFCQNASIGKSSGEVTHNDSESLDDVEFDDPMRPYLSYPPGLGFLFIFVTLLIGILIRAVMLRTSMCLPYRVVMFALGGITGFCASHYPSLKPIISICYVDVEVLFLVFIPIVEFNMAYSVDAHPFWKSFPSILVIAVIGTMMSAIIIAFMACFVIETSWNIATGLLFGVACSPIQPTEVIKQLQERTKGKYLSVLLLGERLVGDAALMMAFTCIFGYLSTALSSASQITLMLLRYAGGGILLGILNGKITSKLLSITYYDTLSAVSITLVSAYLTYYIGEKILYVSGILSVVIAGVIISNTKSTVSGDVEKIVSEFWNIVDNIASTLIFTMAGVVIFEKVALVLSVRQLSVVFVTYATVYISRLLVYATLMPVLKFAGFQITWQHSLSLVWGGLRGPLSLFMALIVLETPGVADAGEAS